MERFKELLLLFLSKHHFLNIPYRKLSFISVLRHRMHIYFMYADKREELWKERQKTMTNQQYYSLIKPYEDAGRVLDARLETLNHSLYGTESVYGPVHYIQSRVKSKKSMEDKLRRLGLTNSLANARDYIQDIMGYRVICYFVKDVFNLTEYLKKQKDLIVIKERDYITAPKQSGYRSYHIVLGIPVYYRDTMEYFPVEIQFRTMSMDFWACMEHRVCYKKNPENREELVREFLHYAKLMKEIEEEIKHYNEV